jgi:galactoside O-acetyltransferase
MKNNPLTLIGREISSHARALVRNVPGMTGCLLRRWAYASLFKECGKAVYFPCDVFFKGFRNIELGDKIIFGNGCRIFAESAGKSPAIRIGNNVTFNTNVMVNADTAGEIVIGDDAMIGPNTVMRSANHRFSDPRVPISRQGHEGGSIAIGAGAWIGANCVLLPGVSVGSGAVIGAGSVVTKSIGDFEIAAGVPCRVIGSRLKP